MGWEYEGLFDALPEEGGNLLSEFWKKETTSTRIGSMGYRTHTIKAGTRLEAEVHPIFGRSMETTARAAKERLTPERQHQLNTRRSKHRLILLLENNFRIEEDVVITLTYAKEPESLERCQKDLRNYYNKLRRRRKKKNLPELKYIHAIGHDQNQRIHVHVVMNGGLTQKELRKIWGKGIVNGYELQSYGKGLQGMANYLYKQNEKARDRGERIGYHMWKGSRNLKKPKERVSDTKISNRKVKLIAQSFGNMSKEIMEKIYPGYTLEDCRVLYSDVVDGVYIRCVMRKRSGP